MSRQPDFELWTVGHSARHQRRDRLAIGVAAAMAVAAVAWCAMQWRDMRAAELALVQLQAAAKSAPKNAPAVAVGSDQQEQVARLLARPVDAWLRVLEVCVPDQGRLLEVQIKTDPASARVRLELISMADFEVAMRCLQGSPTNLMWQLKTVRREISPIGSSEATVWRAELDGRPR